MRPHEEARLPLLVVEVSFPFGEVNLNITVLARPIQ
jgi:hypothetical protein